MGRIWPYILVSAVAVAGGGFLFFKTTTQSKPENIHPVAQPSTQTTSVPWPTTESFTRTFLELINEHRIPEAVSMLDELVAADDTARQSWGVQFANFASLNLLEIARVSDSDEASVFRVMVDAKLKANLTALPIPNYGWDDGQNTRWITVLKKDNHHFKIGGLATGP